MNRFVPLTGLMIVFGCADDGADSPESVSTRLDVAVFLGEPGRSWDLEVFEVPPSGERQVIARADSHEGAVDIDLGFRSGTFFVRATSDGQEQLSAFVNVELDETARVSLTPFTHLAAVLAETLEGTAETKTEGAKALVFGHFLGLAHDEIRPFDVRSEPAVSFTDDVASGFLLEAFATLARSWSSDRANGAISVGRLLDAVATDLVADGLFDGRGDRGQPILLAGRELDSSVLRADLGRALLSFAESAENVTAFSREDIQSAADALAMSRGPLFPDGETEPLDDEGPVVTRWFFSRNGVPIPASQPLRDMVDLEVELEDESGVAQVDFSVAAAAAVDRSAARLPFDTTLVPDGPQTAELIAIDDIGNESRLVIAFDVDNTPPALLVNEIGRITGTAATIAGTASDDRGAVSEVLAIVGDAVAGAASDVDGPFAFEVVIACGRRFAVVVRASDRAGNITEARQEVLCDATSPVIEVLATSFIQENCLEAVHVDDGARIEYQPGPNGIEQAFIDAFTVWPIRIRKYLNRLDDLSDIGLLGGGANIPRIRFRATELAGQPVSSAWERLVIEYRYVVDGDEVRPWTELEPIDNLPEYEVSISYQSLGPELGSAGSSSEHVIEVRATDEAGLAATQSFPFGMDLLSPPIRFSDCRLSSTLASFQIGAQNLAGLYGSLPETEAMTGEIAYPLHLPPGSAAPPITARLMLTPPNAETHVTELWQDTHFATANHPDSSQPTGCGSSSYSLVEMPRNRNVGCFLGVVDLEQSLQRDALGLNDTEVHATRVELRRGVSVIQPGQGGAHLLEPDAPADLRAMLVAPRVLFDGVVYDWRVTFSLPSGYVAGPFPPRYRVDRNWHRGVQLHGYGNWFAPDVAFVTRPFVHELEIAISPVPLSAEIVGRTDIAVGVQLEPECELPIIHQTTAP